MSTLRRLKPVIAFLCSVTAFAAVVLASVAQLEFWRSPDCGWLVLSGLTLGILSVVAARWSFDVGRPVTGLCTALLGSALAVFCGTVLAWAAWLTYFGGRPGHEVNLGALFATLVFFRALDWVFDERN